MVGAAPYSATGGTNCCEAISQVTYFPRRLAESVLQILNSLRPMGMSFVSPGYEWLLLAEEVAGEIASRAEA